LHISNSADVLGLSKEEGENVYWKTQKATYQRGLVRALLEALTAIPAAILLLTPKIVLWTDGPTITPDFDPTTYTAPTFHGYAAGAVTLSGPVNIGGTDLAMIASVDFTATSGGTIDDTCNGYALVDTSLAIGYLIERFPSPVSFGTVGDFLQIDLVVPLPMIYSPVVS
jgi:hypothetical protein